MLRLERSGFVMAAILALSTVVTGCAFLSALGGGGAVTAAGQIAVEEATAAAIQANCKATPTQTLQQCYDAKAAKVLVVAQVMETASVSMALSDLAVLLNKSLTTLNLTPEEEVPLTVLVSTLMDYITPLVGKNTVLAAAGVAVVNQVGSWVASEAMLYSPSQSAKAKLLIKK